MAWRGPIITLEDHLNARLMAYPMCILDNDTPHPGGYIAGIGAIPYRKKGGGVASLENLEEMNAWHTTNRYDSAGLQPQDVDLKHGYDGFSPMVWMWLEAFGFAPKGEAHAWGQPEDIAREGKHPLNTSGGNLGNGRIHGWTQVHEAMQAGTAGPRPLPKVPWGLVET